MSKLSDWIIDCASGPFGSDLKVENFVPIGFPVIDGANLNNCILEDNISKFVTYEKAQSLSRSIANRHDVIVTISGTLGQISFIPMDSKYKQYLCSQRQFRVTFDETKVDVEYLVYYFHTKAGQKKILSFANYVGVPALSQPLPNFKNIEVDFPPINEQHKIAKILKNIDDIIKSNSQINNQMQSLMSKIYNYWFLQFEFPDQNNKPYKSSGGKMIFNKELQREIPEKWSVITLGQILEKANCEKFDSKFDTQTIDLSIMPSSSINLNKLNSSKEFQTNLFKMEKHTILFGGIRPYLKKACIAPCDGAVTGTIISFKPKQDFNFNFCLCTIISDIFFKFAVQNSKGTKMPVVSCEDLLSYKIPYNEIISKKFNDINLKNIISTNIVKNLKLSSLKDFLLPMLMNGQIKLKNE